jgi:hypothetical protein
MIIIFGGLPGTGKTSIAKRLASRLQAVYLRLDSIEQTIRNDDPTLKEIGPVGYQVAYALAADNLSLGLEHFKKFCSRALWRHSGARVLEYYLYTAGLRSSFLTIHRLQNFLKCSNSYCGFSELACHHPPGLERCSTQNSASFRRNRIDML